MTKRIPLIALILALCAPAVNAASISISFSAGQNTYTQTNLIPRENVDKCAEFQLVGVNCTTANMTSRGCVNQTFANVTKTNLVYKDCTIYTQDAAGEALFGADQLYRHLLDNVSRDLQTDVDASCVAFKALTLTNQNAVCATLGRPSGCRICR